MYRSLIVSAVALALFAPRAQAIEMFTNFHNGENIGFPPMEVPTAIYGRGGWNRNVVMGCPVRVQSIEPVPAMMPTGYVRCNHVWKGYEVQYVGDQTRPVGESTQYVSDRRHGWGGPSNWGSTSNWSGTGNAPIAGYSQQVGDYDAPQSSAQQSSAPHSPTPAKLAPKSDEWTNSLEPAAADNETTKRPTSVFARPATAPQGEPNGQSKTSGVPRDERSLQPSAAASSRRTSEHLRPGEAAQSEDQR